MDEGTDSILRQVQDLVREHRACCLWFLADDYLPRDRQAALTALRLIERHGDRRAYVRARKLREWLSPSSSGTSAASSPVDG